MIDGTASEIAAVRSRSAGRMRRSAPIAVVLIALVAGGVGGYLWSRHRTPTVHVLVGNAAVLKHQAAVEVGGWTYGFAGQVPLWIDSSGTTHEASWPDCLDRHGSSTRIRFGEVPVTAPTGVGEREVVWVDCRG